MLDRAAVVVDGLPVRIVAIMVHVPVEYGLHWK